MNMQHILAGAQRGMAGWMNPRGGGQQQAMPEVDALTAQPYRLRLPTSSMIKPPPESLGRPSFHPVTGQMYGVPGGMDHELTGLDLSLDPYPEFPPPPPERPVFPGPYIARQRPGNYLDYIRQQQMGQMNRGM